MLAQNRKNTIVRRKIKYTCCVFSELRHAMQRGVLEMVGEMRKCLNSRRSVKNACNVEIMQVINYKIHTISRG